MHRRFLPIPNELRPRWVTTLAHNQKKPRRGEAEPVEREVLLTQVTKHMGNMARIYNSKPRALHSNTEQSLPDHFEPHPITQNFLPPTPVHLQPPILSVQHPKTASTPHPKPCSPEIPAQRHKLFILNTKTTTAPANP